jgi:uncharacterized protein YkwD
MFGGVHSLFDGGSLMKKFTFSLFAVLAIASVSYGQCGAGGCSTASRRSMRMQPTMMMSSGSTGSSWGSSSVPASPMVTEVEVIALKAVNGERARAAVQPVTISQVLAEEARNIAAKVGSGMDGKKLIDSSPYTVVIAKAGDLNAIRAVQAWTKSDKSAHVVLAPDANVCGYAVSNGVAVLLMGVQK